MFSKSSFLIALCTLVCVARQIADGKRLRVTSNKCQDDECLLKPRHFSLYSNVKQALQSDFNLNGKDLIPFLRSIEVLERRFVGDKKDANIDKLAGHQLVVNLLRQEKLVEAIKVFYSSQGQSLINLYGSSMNGRNQNLACSEWRIKQIDYAEKKMKQNVDLAKLFSNIHRNFLKKSAKKCLRHSCNSIDEHLSRIDSVLRKPSRFGHWALEEKPESESSNEIGDAAGSLNNTTDLANNPMTSDERPSRRPINEREFEQEELELCRFFKRTNESGCQISGKELSEISLVNEQSKPILLTNGTGIRLVDDFLRDYQAAGSLSTSGEGSVEGKQQQQPSNEQDVGEKQVSTTLDTNNDNNVASTTTTTSASTATILDKEKFILAKCHTIKPLLAYNLSGLRWYLNKQLIDQRKLVSRTHWCPSLAYWLELDRLCGELEQTLALGADAAAGTFAYL